ncbi:hypothetical protein [Pseudobacillus wudalianchiensis]|uniref:hypothetical protein n=1 Tax=Pseudobacillus wudalianchiensis TaxID=1743143 RepID=UPI001146550F|nr:hypothetical protein [Bacillus wudalianchiensis]
MESISAPATIRNKKMKLYIIQTTGNSMQTTLLARRFYFVMYLQHGISYVVFILVRHSYVFPSVVHISTIE